jgi:hypothetical protein
VTDVGSVTWAIPCIQIGFAMTEAPGHSTDMADDTITPRGIEASLMAARVLALSAIDLACDPAALDEARNYLKEARSQTQ